MVDFNYLYYLIEIYFYIMHIKCVAMISGALVRASNIEGSRICLQLIVCKEDFILYLILGRRLFQIPFDLFWYCLQCKDWYK